MNSVFIGSGLKAEGRNLCVLNVLRTLLEVGATVRLNNYNRGTVKTTVIGEHKTDDNIIVKNLISNQKNFNFSVNCEIHTVVESVSESGETVLVPNVAFRSYNIVRDGATLVNSVTVSGIDSETYELFRNASILFYKDGSLVMPNTAFTAFADDVEFVVRFDNLPIASNSWNPKTCNLVDYIKEDVMLSEKLKIVRKAIKALRIADTSDDSNSGCTTEVVKQDAKETYEVSCVVYDLPKYKADVDEASVLAVCDTLENAEAVKKMLSDRQRDVRFIIRSIVFATELNSNKFGINWSALAPMPRSKTKFVQTADFEGEFLRRVEFKETVEK